MTLNPKITINRRHQRSLKTCAAIMSIVGKHIETATLNACHKELFDFINDEGMEIITDKMRQAAGLEPRNIYGCTPLELMLIEYFFVSHMLRPIILNLPSPVTGELIKDDDK